MPDTLTTEIQRLTIGPNDRLIVKMPKTCSPGNISDTIAVLKRLGFTERNCAMFFDDISLTVIDMGGT